MRQDRIFARILLIFSVANVAIAAPAVVRQRHLDVAKAASEKRRPGLANGETGGDLPPESSSAEANRITTQASEASGSGNAETGDLPADSSSHISPHDSPPGDWAWFHRLSSQPEVPESSSAAENRVAAQASGALGLGSGETGYWTAESSPHAPLGPHVSPTQDWAWLYDSTTESSSAASDRITTHASGASMASSGSGAAGYLPHGSSSAALDRITTSVPGASMASSGNGETGHLPLESSPAAANHITTQPSEATTSSGLAHSGDLPPHQSSAPTVPETEADGLLRASLTHKALLLSEVLGFVGGTAAIAYGIHRLTTHPYVSPLSPLSCGHLSRVTNILTCDLPQ